LKAGLSCEKRITPLDSDTGSKRILREFYEPGPGYMKVFSKYFLVKIHVKYVSVIHKHILNLSTGFNLSVL
jgi:hypothetical protein